MTAPLPFSQPLVDLPFPLELGFTFFLDCPFETSFACLLRCPFESFAFFLDSPLHSFMRYPPGEPKHGRCAAFAVPRARYPKPWHLTAIRQRRIIQIKTA
jgi:hypothetical protein